MYPGFLNTAQTLRCPLAHASSCIDRQGLRAGHVTEIWCPMMSNVVCCPKSLSNDVQYCTLSKSIIERGVLQHQRCVVRHDESKPRNPISKGLGGHCDGTIY